MTRKPSHRILYLSEASRVAPRISAVLLDWDDTLVDPSAFVAEYYKIAFDRMKQLGYEIPPTFTPADKQGLSPQEYFERLWGERGAEIAMSFSDEIYNSLDYRPTVKPGAKETLQLLHDKHIPVAIVSNLPDRILQPRVKELFGDEFPDLIAFGSHNHLPRKPDPYPFREALAALHVPASKTVYHVGDHMVTDVLGAIATGITPILYERGNSEVPALAQRLKIPYSEPIRHLLCAKTHADLRNLFDTILKDRTPDQSPH